MVYQAPVAVAPAAAGNQAIAGSPSNAFLMTNMFDPATETELGWDIDIRDDVIRECSQWVREANVLKCMCATFHGLW